MTAIRIELTKELHKELKMIALKDDTTLQKLIPILLVIGIAHQTHATQQPTTSSKHKAKNSTLAV